MKHISLNIGRPRQIQWQGKTVTTAIFKEPVDGPSALHAFNLEGDQQADLTDHGGIDKPVYAYPVEHYPFWQNELPDMTLPYGQFGENLTTSGLLEDTVHIGDRFRIGTAELIVTQPRLPCYKLGLRFGRSDMVKRVLASRRTGFYFAVLQEVTVQPGDPLQLTHQDQHRITVADITRLYAFDEDNLPLLHRAPQVKAHPQDWRGYFQERIEKYGR
jgi:MOSC domain-containing protein YiiM